MARVMDVYELGGCPMAVDDSDGHLPGQAWLHAFHWSNEMPAEQELIFFYTYKNVGTCNKESLIACF